MSAKIVYLSLGSNIGDREANLRRACEAIESEDLRILKRSSIYETEPQEVATQAWFLNLVIECETRRFPVQLMTILLKIEREMGRVRGAGTVRKGPRTIDIDILLFGNVIMETPLLTLPHPRMLERRFVLEPLLEIASELRHPQTKEPLTKYLAQVTRQKIKKFG